MNIEKTDKKQKAAIQKALTLRNDWNLSLEEAKVVVYSQPPRVVAGGIMFLTDRHQIRWEMMDRSSEEELAIFFSEQLNNRALISYCLGD
jgi:hypothetical protein